MTLELNRRQLLRQTGVNLGGAALATLLNCAAGAESPMVDQPTPSIDDGGGLEIEPWVTFFG